MKVHVIKIKTISNYSSANSGARKGFALWMTIIKAADWYNPQDISLTYANADILGKGSNRVVFDIGGNKYRMICSYYFGQKRVHLYINWLGSHAEYTKLCTKNLQFTTEL